jgi:glycosyltransferase involved in cell wall biosynthesis
LRDDLPFAKHRSDAPCLSIGLPVHDGERFLEATLDGLLSQTFEDFELIVADNASSDATEDICRAYAVRDRRIRYIRRPANAGVLANFNLTFEQSRGRYFKWAAADDIVRPEFVARCVGILESDPGIVLCHSNTEIIDEHDVVVGSYRYRSGHASGVSPSGRFNDVLREDRWCFALFGVVRSDALRTTRLLAGHVGSDRSLLAELALRGRFGIVADDLFRSRDHPAARGSPISEPSPARRIRESGAGAAAPVAALADFRRVRTRRSARRTAAVRARAVLRGACALARPASQLGASCR